MILCSCANINERKVRDALAQGARTLADIQAELGAAMACGRCRDAVVGEISRHCGHDEYPKSPIGVPQPA